MITISQNANEKVRMRRDIKPDPAVKRRKSRWNNELCEIGGWF